MTAHYALVFLSGTLERLAALPCPLEQSVRWFLKGLCLASGFADRGQLVSAFRTRVAGLDIWCVADHSKRQLRVLRVQPADASAAEAEGGAEVIPLPSPARG